MPSVIQKTLGLVEMSGGKRVWLVTGCSKGFGEEFVNEILSRGETVIATARNVSTLSHLQKAGAITRELDVTSPLPAIREVVDGVVKQFGKIDVLVNNAGYLTIGTIEETTPEETLKQFNTNVFGLLNVTRAALPHMRAHKSGVIVNIGSYGGFVGNPGVGLYAASKFAVEGITESLRLEVKGLGIDVLVVEPGAFRTSFLAPTQPTVAQATIEDYKPITSGMITGAKQYHGNQPGDPRKAAKRVIDVVTKTGLAAGKEIPVRLALGADASSEIKTKCEKVLKDLEEWKSVSDSTSYDA